MIMKTDVKINLVTDIFGNSGYSHHGRSLANALAEDGADVRVECPLIQNWWLYCNDKELEMIKKDFTNDAVTVMISQPQSWPMYWSQKPKMFYGFLVMEGDRCPHYWIKYVLDNNVRRVLVPSVHTRDSVLFWADTDDMRKRLSDKIVIVPHGVDSRVMYPDRKEKNKTFTFTGHKGWSRGISDRGGVQWLLKAFNEEFNDKDNVQLKLKINPVYGGSNFDVKAEFEKLGLKKRKRQRILVTTDIIDENNLRKFYNEGDVFVSPSMGDAFNLPVLEAMACGLPVITTYFGGMNDYVTKDCGFMMGPDDGKLVDSDEPYYESVKWFRPDVMKLRKLMRKAYENRAELKQMGLAALERSGKFLWSDSAKILIKTAMEDFECDATNATG